MIVIVNRVEPGLNCHRLGGITTLDIGLIRGLQHGALAFELFTRCGAKE